MKLFVFLCVLVAACAKFQSWIQFNPDFYPLIKANSQTISFSFDSNILLFITGKGLMSYNRTRGRDPQQMLLYTQYQIKHFNNQLDFISYQRNQYIFQSPYRSVHWRLIEGTILYEKVTSIEDSKILDISPDDSLVLLNSNSQIGYYKIQIADANDFNVVYSAIPTLSRPTFAKFSLDGKYIFVYIPQTLLIYNATTATYIRQILFDSHIIDLQFQNQHFVTVTKDKVLAVWDISDFRQVSRQNDFDSCGFIQYSKDNKYLLYMNSSYLLSILDPGSFEVLQTIQGSSCAFKLSQDSKILMLAKDQIYQGYYNR